MGREAEKGIQCGGGIDSLVAKGLSRIDPDDSFSGGVLDSFLCLVCKPLPIPH